MSSPLDHGTLEQPVKPDGLGREMFRIVCIWLGHGGPYTSTLKGRAFVLEPSTVAPTVVGPGASPAGTVTVNRWANGWASAGSAVAPNVTTTLRPLRLLPVRVSWSPEKPSGGSRDVRTRGSALLGRASTSRETVPPGTSTRSNWKETFVSPVGNLTGSR